jgi:hypothetical protein
MSFRYFRKHSKAFMATAAVICMFLFVFASGTGGSGNANDNKRMASATVAAWDGGSINEGQLASLLRARLITNDFLQRLFQQGGGQSRRDLPDSVPVFLVQSERSRDLELEVVYTEVFSSLATSAGMSVDDEMINYYIQQFGLNRVDGEAVRAILSNTGDRNARSNEALVFATLRKLLLAHFYRQVYDDEAWVVLPEQRWEDWRQINEKISLTAAIVPLERFLGDVPEPKEADLRRLYDQFKDRDPDLVQYDLGRQLPSPDPGFAEPRQVKLQYLSASVSERTQALLDTVTEEEIVDYYERNKRSDFTKMEADAAEDFDNEPPAGEGAPTGDAALADGAGESAPAGESETPAAETPAAEEAAPSGDAPAEAAADDAAPADAAPADAQPATGGAEAPAEGAGDAQPASPPAADAPAAATGDQSTNRRPSPFRFAALQAAPAANATDAADGEPPSAETDAASQAAGDNATPESTDVTANDQPAAEEAEAPAAAADTTNDAPAADEAAADATAESAKPADAEEEFEYLPLDEVRDEIRETLARDKAAQQLDEQVSEASAKLQTEYNQYGRAVVEAQVAGKPAPKPPAKLASLQWLADEYKLTLVTTELLTWNQLLELEVGKALDDQSGNNNVTQIMFSNLKPFEPIVARELEGDRYIVVKTEEAPRRVPTFDEIRDKVALAWRRIEAGKLAEKKAEELAKESESSTESFDEFFKAKGYEVVPQTALFSWRSYTLGPGMGDFARLSEVPELKNVGQDFMEAVFSLKDDQVKSQLNFDRSTAYVFRIHTRQYTPDELKKRFLEEANTWMGRGDTMSERYSGARRQLDQKLLVDVAKFEFDKEWEASRLAQLAEQN